MAVNAAELMVKIGADNSELNTKMNETDGILNRVGGTMGTVAKVGMAGLVTGVGAVAVGLGSSVGKAQDFEAALSGIQAVSGATSAEMDQISAKALQIGKDTAFSATEGAAAISELAKAGVSIPDIMNGAADATVALAAASGVSMPEAAALASNALNQFHLSAKDLPDVVNLMAGAANASAIDMKDFGYSMSAVGAVANLVGLDFKSTAVAIAEMGNAGIKGSDAGTSLKSFLQSLTPSSKPAIAAMQELGLMTKDGANAFFDASGKLKSMAEIQDLLQKATAGLTAEQKQMYLTTIFGSDGIRAAAVLAGQGAKGYDDMAAAMGKVSAQDVASTRMGNTKGGIEALKGSIETLQITIGRALLPGIKATVDGFTGLVNAAIPIAEKAMPLIVGAMTNVRQTVMGLMTQAWPLVQRGFQSAIPYFQQAGTIIQANIVPALGRLKVSIEAAFVRMLPTLRDEVLPALQKLGTFVITQVVPALAQLAGWILGTLVPVLIDLYSKYIVLVIQGLTQFVNFIVADVIPAVQRFAAWFTENVIPVLKQVADFIITQVIPAVQQFATFISANVGPVLQQLADWFQTTVMPVLQQFAAWWGTTVVPLMQAVADFMNRVVIPAIAAVIGFVVDHWPQIMAVIGPGIEAVKLAIQTGWNIIVDIFRTVWNIISDIVRAAWHIVQAVVDDTLNIIRGLFMTFTGLFTGDWQKAWDGIKLIFDHSWHLFVTIVTEVLGLIKNIVGDLLGGIGSIIGDIMSAIGTVFRGAWDSISKTVGDALNTIGTWVHDRLTDAQTTITNIWNAIKTFFSGIWEDLKTLAKNALDALFTNIQERLTSIKDNVITPIWNGIKQFFSDIWNAAGGLIDLEKTGVQAIWDSINTVFTSVRDNVVTPIWNGIKSFFSDVWNGAGSILDIVTKGIQAVYDGLQSKLTDIRDNVVTPLWNAVKAIFENAKQGIHDAIMWPFEQARDAIGSVMGTFKSNAATAWNGLAEGINGFIGGMADAINWVSGKLQLGNIIDKGGMVRIPTFAAGGVTPGGPIIVGENGPELLANVPAGMRVFTNSQTQDLIGRVFGGGPWDWAKEKVAGVTSAVADAVRELVAKGAGAALDAAMSAIGVKSPSGAGVLGNLAGGVVPLVKDFVVKGIQGIMDTIKDSIPAAVAGGLVPGGGNPNFDGTWIKPVAGSFVQGSYGAFSHSQIAAVDWAAPRGTIIVAPAAGRIMFDGQNGWSGGTGHTAMLQHGDEWATLYGHVSAVLGKVGDLLNQGQGFARVGAPEIDGGYGQGAHLHFEMFHNHGRVRPEDYMPMFGGGVFDEPMIGIGASGRRWTMAEADAEILLNKSQASRAADALRGSGDVIFQPGAIVIQGQNLKDISDDDLANFMKRAGRVAKRELVRSGGSTM